MQTLNSLSVYSGEGLAAYETEGLVERAGRLERVRTTRLQAHPRVAPVARQPSSR